MLCSTAIYVLQLCASLQCSSSSSSRKTTMNVLEGENGFCGWRELEIEAA